MGVLTAFVRLFSSSKLWMEAEGSEKRELRKRVADFYDGAALSWEGKWGEHSHSGFYDVGATSLSDADQRRAKIRTMEEALAFAAISDEEEKKFKKIIDIGCGIGGTARYLANKFGAEVHGITLSQVEAKRSEELTIAEGLADKISFHVADALEQPFSNGQFDLIWSMESSEHMADKEKYVGELLRVAAPGGRIIIATWCHRDLLDSEKELKPDEIDLLNRICNSVYLAKLCSSAEYIKIFKSFSLEDIRTADWTDNIAPVWNSSYSLNWRTAISLMLNDRVSFGMPLMMEGYKKKLVKYAIITCRKPE